MDKGGMHDGGDKDMHDEGGETFLINSAVCPDMKPGDEMVVRIVSVHDGEYEVAYAPKDKEDHQEGGESAPEESSMPAEMGGGESAGMMD